MQKQDTINLIPPAYSNDRAKYFADIIWTETQTGSFDWQLEDNAYLLRAIAAFTHRLSATKIKNVSGAIVHITGSTVPINGR